MNPTDDQHQYADPEGFRDYAARDEWEVRVDRDVPVGAQEAWEAWFPAIWEDQAGIVMRDPGEGRGRVGSVRWIPRLRMTERIVTVGFPAPATAPEVVPSISYTLKHFAVTSYLGYVRFVPIDRVPRSTRIIWCVKWTPSLAGRLMFSGGHALVRTLTSAMEQALVRLEAEASGSAAAP